MFAALGCAAPASHAVPASSAAPEAPAPRCAWDAVEPPAPSTGADGYRYRVSVGPGADQLCVEVGLPPRTPAARTWALDPSLEPFLRDVALAGDGGLTPPARRARGGVARPRVRRRRGVPPALPRPPVRRRRARCTTSTAR